MGHYKSNLRDLAFNLFEVFGCDTLLGTPPYTELDVPTATIILEEVERLAADKLATSLIDSDRHPPVFDPNTSSVKIRKSFKKSYQAYRDAEWWRLELPKELGGTLAPPSLRWAVAELVLGANPAVHMYASGFNFAHAIYRLGTEAQRDIARHIVERHWGATMALTEPDAGSDVGAARVKAIPAADGSWHIEGVKRFITSGEHDLAENIIHLVLARPEGAGGGAKGLSLFLVPKFRFDPNTGELGERNGVYAANTEKKMGLKASATCELRFGEQHPAVGWLLGNIHDGMAQIFPLIQYTRMVVGTKAIATLSTGYLNALEYAKTRVQGPDLTRIADKTSPRVTIISHPDVRRSLLMQKAYAEGLRALVFYTASIQDRLTISEAAGGSDESAARRADLLLPVVKGFGSERSYELLAQSLQILGGSGYLQDYPIEQYLRDAKIDTLYEGTTTIQGMDLFFRHIVRNKGQALTALFSEIHQFAHTKDEALAAERELLDAALQDVQGIVGAMIRQLASSAENITAMYQAGQNTSRLLLTLGDLITGWLLLRQAEVAVAALEQANDQDKVFYTGKVAAARWFARTILPTLTPQRVIAETMDNALMHVPEEAF